MTDWKPGEHDRITHDADALDEVVLTGAMVHIERMTKRRYWMGIYLPDGRRVTLGAKDVWLEEDELDEVPHETKGTT